MSSGRDDWIDDNRLFTLVNMASSSAFFSPPSRKDEKGYNPSVWAPIARHFRSPESNKQPKEEEFKGEIEFEVGYDDDGDNDFG